MKNNYLYLWGKKSFKLIEIGPACAEFGPEIAPENTPAPESYNQCQQTSAGTTKMIKIRTENCSRGHSGPGAGIKYPVPVLTGPASSILAKPGPVSIYINFTGISGSFSTWECNSNYRLDSRNQGIPWTRIFRYTVSVPWIVWLGTL
jgi:hypothetical protein